MRIDAYNAVSQVYQSNKVKSAGKSTTAGSVTDTFQISSSAKNYQVAKSAVAQSPDIREDKVAQIKAAMANGTYSVTARDLADKLLGQSKTLTF